MTATNKKRTKKAAKANTKKGAKTGTTKSKRAAGKSESASKKRTGTKKAIVLELMRRKEGATLAEIAKATDWQNHTIRGFVSGTLAKKMGLTVESVKNDTGERTYRIA
jgi:hypothetical protein